MAKIKETSTNQFNRQVSALICPVTYIVNKIGGHWKPIILYQLMSGPKRYSELRRAIPVISEKMLIQHLKELQADDLVLRIAEPVIPPVVTYRLSAAGAELKPVMTAMAEWAIRDDKRRNKKSSRPVVPAS